MSVFCGIVSINSKCVDLVLRHLCTYSCWCQNFGACLQEETIEEFTSSGVDIEPPEMSLPLLLIFHKK